MVSGPNVSYQPAVAYQGGLVNTPHQDPKTDQTQPKQAPAASAQHSDGKHTSRNSESDDHGSHTSGRGGLVNVKA